jgi:hypothetical protein
MARRRGAGQIDFYKNNRFRHAEESHVTGHAGGYFSVRGSIVPEAD